jgi:glycosyltransferase involved in cell wall biosynthesis|tara:strand:+ start:2354 stop:3217 length:864 start_codon:yes stop_codon:yes gene_type:complete
MFSIIIPTLNNINYLKLCIKSIRTNSNLNHELIVHVNKGIDGTIDFLKNENIKYSYTKYNAGICEGVNLASKLSTTNYILYAHDDFYFCPGWDDALVNELKNLKNNLFYFSGTMIQNGQVDLNCGYSLEDFNEKKLLNEYKNIKFYDFQGSTWAPHLIHKDLWNKIGGFSEEYYPGTGSDPDLNMKLWNEGVRIFKGLQHCKVYHFGSIVTRQKEKKFNTITESGSKGSKLFLVKWGISIKFFKKHFLKSDIIYLGPLKEPIKNFNFYFDLIICKFYYFYLKIFFKS